MKEKCLTKITIENDGKCAALAEVWKGSLKDYGVVIVLETGVGGGIIRDKKIYKGKNFFAGEFSFVATNINDTKNNENCGGISSQDILIKYIQKNVDKYHKGFKFDIPKPNVVRCKFRNDANLIGALYNFITRN